MPFEQNKVTLCWPNLADKCVLTSSSANFARPLNRLQKRVLKDRAITTDTTLSITATLDKPRPVGCVGLFSHNLSADARWRVCLFDAADALLEDSGWQDVWPSVFQSYELAWEDDSFWLGKPDEEDLARFTTQAIWFADKAWQVKKVVIDIADDTNPAGSLHFGRLFLSDVYQPAVNMSYGVRWTVRDESEIDQALDKTKYFASAPRLRACSFALDWLSEDEAFSRLFRMRRDIGITDEVLFAQELAITPRWIQRTMLATAAQADPVTHPDAARHTHALSLEEIL